MFVCTKEAGGKEKSLISDWLTITKIDRNIFKNDPIDIAFYLFYRNNLHLANWPIKTFDKTKKLPRKNISCPKVENVDTVKRAKFPTETKRRRGSENHFFTNYLQIKDPTIPHPNEPLYKLKLPKNTERRLLFVPAALANWKKFVFKRFESEKNNLNKNFMTLEKYFRSSKWFL